MPLTTYTAGEVLTAASLNANFTFAASSGGPIAIFNETQASGTDGGTFTSGSFVKRTLNTTVVNNITGCTLTSSVIALPAGTYEVSAFAPAFEVQRNKTKLRNTTDGTDLAIGFSNFSSNVSTGYNFAYLETSFVLAGTKNIELQHRCETTRATLGFGIPSSFSVSEIYSTITIVKIA